jgi:hypothetical protein
MPKTLVKIGKQRDKDPTRTRPIRDRYVREVDRRFGRIRSAVHWYVVEENRLGAVKQQDRPAVLEEDEESRGVLPPALPAAVAGAYVYEQSSQRVDEFMFWLDEQVKAEVLTYTREYSFTGYGHKNWQDVHIYSAYQRGIAQSLADLRSAGAALPELGSAAAIMLRPFHADRVALLYTRAFNGMKGVTEAMKAQMAHVLAKGMAEGRHPWQIARALADRIDKIGITRARLIARTEIGWAHRQATLNEFAALEGIVGEEILGQWWTALDERVRPRHREWHGKVYTREVLATMIGEPNCLLGTAVVHSPCLLERTFERFYNGPIVIIETTSGNRLACTPNHPIATPHGFLPAGLLYEGDRLLGCTKSDIAVSVGKDEKEIESTIQNVARSFPLSGQVSSGRVANQPRNFHGDGSGSEITIVRSDGKLVNGLHPKRSEHFREPELSFGSMEDVLRPGGGPFLFDLIRVFLSGSLDVSSFKLVRALLRRHFIPLEFFGGASASGRNTSISENGHDSGSGDFELFGQRVAGFPPILFDEISSVILTNYVGHVYNLQTEKGFYLAVDNVAGFQGEVNYYITGNCRCCVLPWTETLAKIRAKFGDE